MYTFTTVNYITVYYVYVYDSKLYIIYIMRLYHIIKRAVPRMFYGVIKNYKNTEIKIRFTNKKIKNAITYIVMAIFYNYLYFMH